jgi:hypothetical protein
MSSLISQPGAQPVIIEDYFSKEDSDIMLAYLNKIESPAPSYQMSGALGYRTSVEADAMSMHNPVQPLTGNAEDDRAILKITETILRAKKDMEEFFDMDLSMVNCNYTVMHPGAQNYLHADSSELDGKPIPESKELEFSALIYLNTQGVDYTGGKLFFPLQDLELTTKQGTLVFFRGDYSRPHGVSVVESGDRKLLILFLTRGGNTSDEPLFLHPGAGVPVEDLSPEDRARYEEFVRQGLLE